MQCPELVAIEAVLEELGTLPGPQQIYDGGWICVAAQGVDRIDGLHGDADAEVAPHATRGDTWSRGD